MQFEASRQRFYNIEEMLEFADDDGSEQWLVHNIIPKVGRTIIFGEGAVFKTFFIFDLAVAVASGGLLFRKLKIGAHGPVMVISTESSKYANARRIISHIRAREAYCAEKAIRERPIVPNTAELPLFYCQQPFDLDNMQDVTSLNQSIMDVEKTCGKPPAMIILDPLDSFMSGDENSAKETRPMRRTLDAIVEAYNTSVVIIHHANKKSEMRGSSSLKGWTDAQIQFTRREAPVVGGRKSTVVDVFVHKQRDGISQVPGFTFHPEIATARGITTFSIIGPDEDQEEVARNTISSEVYNYLNENGPTLQTELVEKLEFPWKQISNALNELVADGQVDCQGQVLRPTNEEGTRHRSVRAWQLTGKTTMIDGFAGVLRMRRATEQYEEGQGALDIAESSSPFSSNEQQSGSYNGNVG